MKEAEGSFKELKRDQMEREEALLSQLISESKALTDLGAFEADLSARRNEILFRITTEMEDTGNALKEAEQLVARLKKHLKRLQELKRILSK